MVVPAMLSSPQSIKHLTHHDLGSVPRQLLRCSCSGQCHASIDG